MLLSIWRRLALVLSLAATQSLAVKLITGCRGAALHAARLSSGHSASLPPLPLRRMMLSADPHDKDNKPSGDTEDKSKAALIGVIKFYKREVKNI